MTDAERVARVVDAWARIDAWLAEHAPNLAAHLAPGATDEEIDAAERALGGVTFPADLRALYRVHNGSAARFDDQQDEFSFAGDKFLSLDEMVLLWREWSELKDKGWWANNRTEPEKGICDEWWSTRWIPLAANDSGDALISVDLAPVEGGVYGQVIMFWNKDTARGHIAESVAVLLTRFADRLEAIPKNSDDLEEAMWNAGGICLWDACYGIFHFRDEPTED